jgi:hypothetical protein
MIKRRKLRIFLAIVLLAAGACVFLMQRREPSYKGRHLSQWVSALASLYGEPRLRPPYAAQAPEAIRQLAPKAVPLLLEWMVYETPAWNRKLSRFAHNHTGLGGMGDKLDATEAERIQRRQGATPAFSVLGPHGAKAVPALISLLTSNRESWILVRARTALDEVAPNAVEALEAGLTNQTPGVRSWCVYALGRAGTNAARAIPALLQCVSDSDLRAEAIRSLARLKLEPARVVPALTNAVQDPNEDVRRAAAWGLSEYGDKSGVAVPILREYLDDWNPYTRKWATNLLRKLAPETLANPATPPWPG